MLEARILLKLPKRVDLEDESIVSEFANLVSSLSYVVSITFPHASLDFQPFIKNILNLCSKFDARNLVLQALCTLASVLENGNLYARKEWYQSSWNHS